MLVELDDSVVVPGDDVVVLLSVVVLVLLLELEPPPAGEGFTIVVLFSFLSPPAGVVTSVLCSQAARSAAPARMQMYFFISSIGLPTLDKADSNRRRRPVLP